MAVAQVCYKTFLGVSVKVSFLVVMEEGQKQPCAISCSTLNKALTVGAKWERSPGIV